MKRHHNPGYLSPYECAYGRAPDLDMLAPFGCLAYVFVKSMDRNGKTNYRKASRVCAMLGYTLKPDGHPLGYKLYDLDLGTMIQRTNDLVVFNKDMPALKFVADRAVKRPVDLYANSTVAKHFDGVLHWGKVVSHRSMQLSYFPHRHLLVQVHHFEHLSRRAVPPGSFVVCSILQACTLG